MIMYEPVVQSLSFPRKNVLCFCDGKSGNVKRIMQNICNRHNDHKWLCQKQFSNSDCYKVTTKH